MAKDWQLFTFHYVETWKTWMAIIAVLSGIALSIARFMKWTDWPFTLLLIPLGLSWALYVIRDALKNRMMSGMDRAMNRNFFR